jgi:hypothetical protein
MLEPSNCSSLSFGDFPVAFRGNTKTNRELRKPSRDSDDVQFGDGKPDANPLTSRKFFYTHFQKAMIRSSPWT